MIPDADATAMIFVAPLPYENLPMNEEIFFLTMRSPLYYQWTKRIYACSRLRILEYTYLSQNGYGDIKGSQRTTLARIAHVNGDII